MVVARHVIALAVGIPIAVKGRAYGITHWINEAHGGARPDFGGARPRSPVTSCAPARSLRTGATLTAADVRGRRPRHAMAAPTSVSGRGPTPTKRPSNVGTCDTETFVEKTLTCNAETQFEPPPEGDNDPRLSFVFCCSEVFTCCGIDTQDEYKLTQPFTIKWGKLENDPIILASSRDCGSLEVKVKVNSNSFCDDRKNSLRVYRGHNPQRIFRIPQVKTPCDGHYDCFWNLFCVIYYLLLGFVIGSLPVALLKFPHDSDLADWETADCPGTLEICFAVVLVLFGGISLLRVMYFHSPGSDNATLCLFVFWTLLSAWGVFILKPKGAYSKIPSVVMGVAALLIALLTWEARIELVSVEEAGDGGVEVPAQTSKPLDEWSLSEKVAVRCNLAQLDVRREGPLNTVVGTIVNNQNEPGLLYEGDRIFRVFCGANVPGNAANMIKSSLLFRRQDFEHILNEIQAAKGNSNTRDRIEHCFPDIAIVYRASLRKTGLQKFMRMLFPFVGPVAHRSLFGVGETKESEKVIADDDGDTSNRARLTDVDDKAIISDGKVGGGGRGCSWLWDFLFSFHGIFTAALLVSALWPVSTNGYNYLFPSKKSLWGAQTNGVAVVVMLLTPVQIYYALQKSFVSLASELQQAGLEEQYSALAFGAPLMTACGYIAKLVRFVAVSDKMDMFADFIVFYVIGEELFLISGTFLISVIYGLLGADFDPQSACASWFYLLVILTEHIIKTLLIYWTSDQYKRSCGARYAFNDPNAFEAKINGKLARGESTLTLNEDNSFTLSDLDTVVDRKVKVTGVGNGSPKSVTAALVDWVRQFGESDETDPNDGSDWIIKPDEDGAWAFKNAGTEFVNSRMPLWLVLVALISSHMCLNAFQARVVNMAPGVSKWVAQETRCCTPDVTSLNDVIPLNFSAETYDKIMRDSHTAFCSYFMQSVKSMPIRVDLALYKAVIFDAVCPSLDTFEEGKESCIATANWHCSSNKQKFNLRMIAAGSAAKEYFLTALEKAGGKLSE